MCFPVKDYIIYIGVYPREPEAQEGDVVPGARRLNGRERKRERRVEHEQLRAQQRAAASSSEQQRAAASSSEQQREAASSEQQRAQQRAQQQRAIASSSRCKRMHTHTQTCNMHLLMFFVHPSDTPRDTPKRRPCLRCLGNAGMH